MKLFKALLLILTLIITSASVLAYSVNIDWTMNKQNYEVELYPCGNSVCSSVGSRMLYGTSSGYTYHMYYTISGNAYHAAYFYKPGYRPIGYTLNAWGDWTTSFTSSFTKKDYCESTIGTLSVSDTNPTLGETIIISAPITSAFTVSDDHPQSPKYYPSSHIDYFTSDILASLKVYDSVGSLVKALPSQTKSVYQDDDQSVTFSLDTSYLTPGSYKIVLSTDPVDSICNQNNKIINTRELWISISPVIPVNTAPVIDGLLDLSFVEDSGLHNDIADLWFYASDAETPDSGLTFTIISQSNAGIVNCVLDSNRYIDCTTQTDEYGYSDIVVRVMDPEGLTDTDTFRITVTPVNDAPAVSVAAGVLDQTIDSCSQFATFDLDDIVSDVDNTDDELTWTVTGNTQLIITVDLSDRTVTVFYPAGFVGSETVTFTATDPDGLSASYDAVFTVTECVSANTAPVLSDIPGQKVDSCDAFSTFDLDDYVTDSHDTDDEISWAVTGNDHLSVSISYDHVVSITYDCGWIGSETLIFTATDTGGLTVSDSAVFEVEAGVAPDDPDDDDDDEKDEGGLTIMSITYDDKVKPGDYLHISIKVKGLKEGIVTSVRIDDLGVYEKFSRVSGINVLIPKNTKPGDYDFQISVKNDDGYKDSEYRSFKVISDTFVSSGSGAGTPDDEDNEVTGALVTVGTASGNTSTQGQNSFNLEGVLGLLIGFLFLLLILGVFMVLYFFKNTKKKKKNLGGGKDVYYDTTGIPEVSHKPVETSPTMPRRTLHGAEATEKFIYGSQQPSSNTFLMKY